MEHGKLVSNPIHNIQVECEILCSIVFSLVLVILEHSFSSHYVYAFLITFDLVSHQNRDIIPDYIQFFWTRAKNKMKFRHFRWCKSEIKTTLEALCGYFFQSKQFEFYKVIMSHTERENVVSFYSYVGVPTRHIANTSTSVPVLCPLPNMPIEFIKWLRSIISNLRSLEKPLSQYVRFYVLFLDFR